MQIEKLIEDFSVEVLKNFFRYKIRSYRIDEENYDYLFEENDNIARYYENIIKIGEADLNNNTEDIFVITAKTKTELTSRSSKKRQYDIAKKILKEQMKDAAFFVFYDESGNFRFSFIRANYLGTKREFTSFKRYTYFVSPKQTNKTFITRISQCDFNNLESIQKAFSIEPVTKEFYEKLQHWYFWALENVKFPQDAEDKKNGREIAVIRLITRIMFMWFMKVRNLIPENLFDEKELKDILKDFSSEESTYYKAILQNLFFATLSTKQKERKFRSEIRGYRGYNPDYGNHNVFRYHDLFKDDISLENLFSKIPFLNGGLFECLDYKTKKNEERRYIDGFTDTKKYQPVVPNFLFFSELQKTDISQYFGKKNKNYEVEGLITILKSYNFTIDENEPDDIEVALDPEMLGIIFENLLAAYNPETETTARKVTGSFYTPREIVNYMTEESLKQYFKTYLGEIKNIDEKLDSLIKSKENENPFNKETTKKLIELINTLRIVDPAVGSGAFPMTILNKLVFILGKLDPDNEFWKQSQIESVKNAVKDPSIQRKLIGQIEKQFKEKNADYGRKLYLIEKCIYGVDIQQIAVEIAKLRFFISLLVDEKIDETKENYGIEPLPNLDFKLMQGNSLISSFAGIDFNKNKEKANVLLEAENDRYKKLIYEFEELKGFYQNEPDNKKKKELIEQIDSKIIEIFEEKLKQVYPQLRRIEEKARSFLNKKMQQKTIQAEKQKIQKYLGFDIEQMEKDLIAYIEERKAKDFFLWDVYFAEVFSEKGGFDIVIGNPPYIQLQKSMNNKQKFADLYKNCGFETFQRTGDIYTLFYEKGIQILNDTGLLCYITSNKWMRAAYGKSLRGFLAKHNPNFLIDLGPGVFSTATVDTNILLIQKKKAETFNLKAMALTKKKSIGKLKNSDFITLTELSDDSWIILTPAEMKIKKRIEEVGTPLKDWNIQINYGIKTGYNEAFIIDGKTKDELIAKDPKSAEIIKPILRGRDIKRYKAEFADKWLINTHNGYTNSKGEYIPPVDVNKYPVIKEHLDKYWDKLKKRQDKGITPYNLRNCAYLEEFKKEKIVYQELTQERSFTFDCFSNFISNTAYLVTGKDIKFLLSFLNSKSIEYYFANCISVSLGGKGIRWLNQYMKTLPIPKIPKPQQTPFEILVDYILFLKSQPDDDKSFYFEEIIDGMVYELYFEEEIKKADCEILKYVENLPKIEDNMSDNEKKRIINNVFERLYNDNHPIRKNLEKMKREVEEIKIIENSLKK